MRYHRSEVCFGENSLVSQYCVSNTVKTSLRYVILRLITNITVCKPLLCYKARCPAQGEKTLGNSGTSRLA